MRYILILLLIIFVGGNIFIVIDNKRKEDFKKNKLSFDDLYVCILERERLWNSFDFGRDISKSLINSEDVKLSNSILLLDEKINNLKTELFKIDEDSIDKLISAHKMIESDGVSYFKFGLIETIGIDSVCGAKEVLKNSKKEFELYECKQKKISKMCQQSIKQFKACNLELKGISVLLGMDLSKVYSDYSYVEKIGGRNAVLNLSKKCYLLLKESYLLGNRRKELLNTMNNLPFGLKLEYDSNDIKDRGVYSWYFSKNIGYTSYFELVRCSEHNFIVKYIKHRKAHSAFLGFMRKSEKEVVVCSSEYKLNEEAGSKVFLHINYYSIFHNDKVGKRAVYGEDRKIFYYLDSYHEYYDTGISIKRIK